MNVKRKTVRFQDSLSDLAVYDAISDYKKYGYRSESHMLLSNVWDKNMSYKLTGTLLPKQKFILYHMEDAVSLTDTTHIKESL